MFFISSHVGLHVDKRKLGLADTDTVTLYTEEDGTEIDKEIFSELDSKTILIGAKKKRILAACTRTRCYDNSSNHSFNSDNVKKLQCFRRCTVLN